jgi:hypothetical protein
MDATALDAVLDLIAREAEREQLDACYHPSAAASRAGALPVEHLYVP